MHVSLGELQVKGGGILSPSQSDIGTERSFYDITKAEEDGHFGPELVIWMAHEMHVALELIASALDLEARRGRLTPTTRRFGAETARPGTSQARCRGRARKCSVR